MAEFYNNETFPVQVARALRGLGHDVVTSVEAGQANRRIPDDEVLAFGAGQRRILYGIVLCTADPGIVGQAQRISEAVSQSWEEVQEKLIRVNRPSL